MYFTLTCHVLHLLYRGKRRQSIKPLLLEATNVCQYYQLCAGLKVVIDRYVNGVQAIWDSNSSMEYWGLILLDKKHVY